MLYFDNTELHFPGITENGPDYNLLTRIASSPSQVLRSLSFNSLNSQIGTLVSASCLGGLTTRPNPNALPGGGFTTKPGGGFFPFRPAGTTPRSKFHDVFACLYSRIKSLTILYLIEEVTQIGGL